jgi:hypothetical protein
MTNSVTTKPDSLSDGEGEPRVYLRDEGGVSCDGQYDECWVVCSKGDPGAVEFRPAKVSAAPDLLEALKLVTQSTEWPTMERDTQDAVLAAIAKAEAAS